MGPKNLGLGYWNPIAMGEVGMRMGNELTLLSLKKLNIPFLPINNINNSSNINNN